MRPSSFESVLQSLARKEISSIYYLTGDAEPLKDELARAIVDATLEPGARDFNLDVRAAADLDAAGLQSLVETLPILAERRVVVIRDLEQWRKNAKPWSTLGQYIENPSSTTVLVLVQGAGEPANAALVRRAVHVDVPAPAPDALRRWVIERARRLGLEMEDEAVAHLLRAVGEDLAHMASELDKLAAAVGSGRRVGPSEVAQMVGVNRGETVDDWVSAVIARNAARALDLTDIVLPQAGVSAVRMVTALGNGLVGVRLARALADAGLAGARLERALFEELRKARPPGGHDWRTQAHAWAAAASYWRADELDAAIQEAYTADRALKATTIRDDRAVLRTLILTLSARAAA
jgi:DNA polymerase-3 subunit delta